MTRAVNIIDDVAVEKVWAATALLSRFLHYIPIDTVGDFLRQRQIDAAAVKFDTSDPATRYALPHNSIKFTQGWDDITLVSALAKGERKGYLEVLRIDGVNTFRAKKKDPEALWDLADRSIPVNPKWDLRPLTRSTSCLSEPT